MRERGGKERVEEVDIMKLLLHGSLIILRVTYFYFKSLHGLNTHQILPLH